MTTAIQVKERPILFSGAMVKALKAGTKTQTRRAIKFGERAAGLDLSFIERNWVGFKFSNAERTYSDSIACPYGKVGDRLWVRETWAPHFINQGVKASELSFGEGRCVFYKADESVRGGCQFNQREPKWRPSIFMPRAASRLLLEITAVRCERLQSISREDAIAEGVQSTGGGRYWIGAFDKGLRPVGSPEQAYRDLWGHINGLDSWATNPWVWVVEFKLLTVN